MELPPSMSLRKLGLNVVGALLVLAGIGLVAMNARSLINYRAAASRHGGEVVDLGANAHPQAGQHGSMVRVVGVPTVVEAPHDPEFNLKVNTPALLRHVEMFQWREVRIGAAVHYELDWVDRLLDASHFKDPDGHVNPDRFPMSGEQFDAGLVQMGGFKLEPVLLHALPGSSEVAPDPAALPANLAASFSQHGNYLVTSQRPGDPRLGDVRVGWDEVPLRAVTIVARVDGDRLVAASDAADGKGYEVQIGDVSLFDMFPDLPVPPEFVSSERILAVLLGVLGAFALLSTHPGRRDPLLALGLGGLAVGAVASMLWLGSDLRMTGAWLTVVALCMVLTIWRLRRAH